MRPRPAACWVKPTPAEAVEHKADELTGYDESC